MEQKFIEIDCVTTFVIRVAQDSLLCNMLFFYFGFIHLIFFFNIKQLHI
jgi:hypothetical protein